MEVGAGLSGCDLDNYLRVDFERVDATGDIVSRTTASLVFAEANRNDKLEFSFGDATILRTGGRP